MKRFAIVVLLVAVLGSVVTIHSSRFASSSATVVVQQSAGSPGVLVGPASSSLRIAVSVGFLDPQMTDSLNQVLEGLYSSQSSIYHSFLTSQQYADMFAPTSQVYQQAVSYFQSQGLAVYTDNSRLFVNLDGTVSQFQNAFGTTVQIFRNGNAAYYANSAPLSLPQSIAPFVTSAIGFENYTFAQPLSTPPVSWPLSQPPYVPSTVQTAYNESGALSRGIDGTGQKVVVVDAFGDESAVTDLAQFSTTFGLPNPSFTLTTVNASNTVQDVSTDSLGIVVSAPPVVGWDVETALDIEWAHAMAPGAGIVNMIGLDQGVGVAQGVATAIADHMGSVVSQSFGLWEGDANNTNCCVTGAGNVTLETFAVGQQSWIQYLHPFYQMAAATGITVLASSGDSGSASGCCSGTSPAVAANYPVADTFVTGVGGTSLYASSAGYQQEVAWTGSGGGFSTIFSRPGWQNGPGVPASGPTLPNGDLARGEPDVAAVADSATGVEIVVHSAFTSVGGTSVASPVWGGIIAVLNSNQAVPEGFFAPAAYSILNSGAYCRQFHDVTTGGNGAYSAGPGWDPVTGVGSPNVGYLLNPLPGCSSPPAVTITSPSAGATVTTSSLTVSGTDSLGAGNWLVAPKHSTSLLIPAGACASAGSAPQLNIVQGYINDYRPGFFNVNLKMSDLTNLAVPPAIDGEVWLLVWNYGTSTYYAGLYLYGSSNVTAGGLVGLIYNVGLESPATSGSGQLPSSHIVTNGSYTPTAPGTITVTVPTTSVGNPGPGSTLTSLTVETWTTVGLQGHGVYCGTDSYGSVSYNLGDPLFQNGYVQVATNSNFQGATNATLVNYPATSTWQATLNLAGLSSGSQVVYARQVAFEHEFSYNLDIPSTAASVSFTFQNPNQPPPSGLTVTTDSSSYTVKQNVLISGVLTNPATGAAVSGAGVRVQVVDPLGSTVLSRTVTTGSTGGYSTSYHLPKNALQGFYQVYASSNGFSASTKFVVDNSPPTLSNVQVTPTTGNRNTVFTVSAVSTDNVAIYSVYGLVETTAGVVVANVSLAHQSANSYAASFNMPSTAPLGSYTVQVHTVDVAGKTATANSNTFTLTL